MAFWLPFILLILLAVSGARHIFSPTSPLGMDQVLMRLLILIFGILEVVVLLIWKWHGSEGRIIPGAWIAVILIALLLVRERRYSAEWDKGK